MLQATLFDSIQDYLERWFVSDYVKAPLAYGAMSGSAAKSCRSKSAGTCV